MIAIIAILAAILFPVFARARENARRSSCTSNLKQIGLGILQYVQDYDEKMPNVHNDGTGSNRYLGPSSLTNPSSMFIERHLETINVLRADGHVKSVKIDTLVTDSTPSGIYKAFTIAAAPD